MNLDRCFTGGLTLGVPFCLLVVIPQFGPVGYPLAGSVAGFLGLLLLLFGPEGNDRSFRWRDILIRGLAWTAVGFLLLSALPIGAWLCRPLLLPPATGNADAIVVLAAGVTRFGNPSFSCLQRVMHGASLLREGRAPRLIFSTGDPIWEGVSEANWIASWSTQWQSPSQSVEIATGGITTTRTEARTHAERLLPRGIRRILLVTNGPHILRATRVFAAQGFEVLPAPVQTARDIEDCLSSDFEVFRYAIHEWVGLAVYWLRGDFEPPPR